MRRGWVVLGIVAGTLLLSPWTPARAEPAEPSGAPGPGQLRCGIDDPRITESSGLAAAGDRLYTLNDGGSRLEVFVLDAGAGSRGPTPTCRVVRTITAGIDPYDVEDLARSADGTLWLADVGDNDHRRRTVAIELLPETGAARLFRFSYPDGAHDAEALLLDRSGRPFIVTKEVLGNSGVYTPAGTPSASRPTPLRRVAGLQFTPTGTAGGPVGTAGQLLVTGGAVSPDGTRIVLRTYTDAYLWRADDGDVARALTSGKPVRFALPPTPQGEAVTFTPDGRSLLTSTEGRPAAVHLLPLGELAAPAATRAADPAPSGRSGAPTGRSGAPDGKDGPAGAGGGSGVVGALAVALGLAAAVVWVAGRAASTTRRG